MWYRRVVAITAWMMVSIASVAPVGAADTAAIGAEPDCNSPYDPYSAAQGFRDFCGVTSYPLVQVKGLPDGGKSFVYDIAGELGWTNMPPAAFDPTTATADQLALYGYPEKPSASDASALDGWASTVARRKLVQPPVRLYGNPSVHFTNRTSLNWAGYNTKGNTFTKAYLTFTISQLVGPPVPPCLLDGAVGFWTGLGGVNTSNLAQNGTAIGTPGLGYYQGWWEILPAGPVAVPIYGTNGKSFTVFTTRNTNGTFTFQWFNNYTDDSYTFNKTSSSYDGSTADFIIERVKVNGAYESMSALVNPESFRGDANALPINTYSNDKWTMVNSSSQTLLSTSALAAGGESFTTTQQRCA